MTRYIQLEPEIEIELGPRTLQTPLFNKNLTEVHLCLEEAIDLTKEPVSLSFDVKIRNPDGYYGMGSVSSLMKLPYDIWGGTFTAVTSVFTPTFSVSLPWWGKEKGPIRLPAGTPILMYRYFACEFDDCGHKKCEDRNKKRFESRWEKMTDAERQAWKNRNKRVRCMYQSTKFAPIRDENNEDIAHLRTEKEIVVRKAGSAIAFFDVEFDLPFGWHAECSVSELSGLDGDLKSSGCKVWDGSTKPVLELKLNSPLDAAELVIPKGTPLCKVEMVKHSCGCPRCFLMQNEEADKRPKHDIYSDPNY